MASIIPGQAEGEARLGALGGHVQAWDVVGKACVTRCEGSECQTRSWDRLLGQWGAMEGFGHRSDCSDGFFFFLEELLWLQGEEKIGRAGLGGRQGAQAGAQPVFFWLKIGSSWRLTRPAEERRAGLP